VATPEDCASGRMGESVYEFAARELPGALKGGWEIEAARLRKKGLKVWGPHNEILQADAITLVLALILVAWLGLAALPVILAHHALGWFALTLVNYIEHYGLLRQKRENGRYEPVQPRHSWNTNHIFSNLLEIHLQRHSDHHAHPMRPYQALRDFEGIPLLPTGYPGCFGMALFPPVWFKVMDPRVMEWAEDDLSKVNIHPPARARLEARWGKARERSAA
jgi:alkane 1-monooxygenase